MCLAQRHNVVTPVRLEHEAPRSRVKHSTTEPLRSYYLPLLIEIVHQQDSAATDQNIILK